MARRGALVQRHRRRGSPVATFAYDTFTRANSTTSLGTAESGQAWTAVVGTWGITGNQAYCPSGTANAVATVDAGVADCTVRAAVPVGGTNANGIYVRVQDASNWIRLVPSSGSLYLQKMVGGTVTTVASAVQAVANNDVLGLVLAGTSVTPLLNGVAVIGGTQTITDFATVTNHGIGLATGSAAGRWDNFSVQSA